MEIQVRGLGTDTYLWGVARQAGEKVQTALTTTSQIGAKVTGSGRYKIRTTLTGCDSERQLSETCNCFPQSDDQNDLAESTPLEYAYV